MIHRLSVNALLKSVIAVMAAAVVAVLSSGAWDAWTRVNTANRIAEVVEATTYIFTALHNGRVDRASTRRELLAERSTFSKQLQDVRAAEMPALQKLATALRTIDFPEKPALLASLQQSTSRTAAIHQESNAALQQPKDKRRSGLADEAFNELGSLLETLDKLSASLTRLIKLEDPVIDQLMTIKQLAWVARNNAGDASVILSNTLAGIALPPDALMKQNVFLAKAETAWSALTDIAAGMPLPDKFHQAAKKAREGFFAPDHLEMRTRMIKQLIAGEKITVAPDEWTQSSVARLATILDVAEAALEIARDRADAQHAAAMKQLCVELVLLFVALGLAGAMMLMVSRRVTSPLLAIKDAMLKLAGGDLTASVEVGNRKDEIGALAGSMQTFKDSMIEAERLRTEQKEAEARTAAERQAAEAREQAQRKAVEDKAAGERAAVMRKLADDFEAAVGRIIASVSSASGELESSAGTLTRTAEKTQQLAGVVESASEEASTNVGAVATAAEEMTGSVNEIARQVETSSKIAAEAVKQAEKTDARITELSHAASRIGDVVKLITAIAEQTNLLALNATIEAARAGEAGKGFAVVAQEVKALASQTAKATDEIGAQIAGMQTATQDSVAAIKEISGTIGRIAEIASTIAAAVEEQGAATGEIARNVQEAANGTARVADNISDVNRGANETGTASAQVLSAAKSLSTESRQLKAEVEKFLQTVRAA